VEIAVDDAVIGLRLLELVPRFLDERLVRLAEMPGAHAHLRDEMIEGGALLCIEVELAADQLEALGWAQLGTRRLAAHPKEAADEEGVEGEREREQDPRQARQRAAAQRCTLGLDAHVPLASLRPLRKPVGGSSSSSEVDAWLSAASTVVASLPSAKPR